eukprot:scaffold94247_cov61-Phaeocystis_antarctica.AAC.5
MLRIVALRRVSSQHRLKKYLGVEFACGANTARARRGCCAREQTAERGGAVRRAVAGGAGSGGGAACSGGAADQLRLQGHSPQ